MFHDIPPEVLALMAELEDRDERDRTDGTAHLERLRQIPRDTGRFLALLAASSPEGQWIEIGTSAGYSALWISLAGRVRSTTLRTFEILPEKATLARASFSRADVSDLVELIEGDFLDRATLSAGVSFCFLDAEKDVYGPCFDRVVPMLVPGGLLVADNVISHHDALRDFVDTAMSDDRLDCVVVPIGKGELVCRRR